MATSVHDRDQLAGFTFIRVTGSSLLEGRCRLDARNGSAEELMRNGAFLGIVMLLLAPATACAQGLKGARGIREAQRGGMVITCRHAATEPADENEQTLRYDDPSTQRRLSARGERQAESLGKAFRDLGIPITEVIASPMQRTRRTAELAFGTAQLDSSWHTRGEYYGGRKRDRRLEMLGRPVERGNRVIVSHIGTMYSVLPSVRGELEEGDCVVVRPRGDTQFDIVEVVPWRSWVTVAGSSSPQ